MKSKIQSGKVVIILYCYLLVSFLGSGSIAVAQPVANSGLVLRDGVVIEQNRNELYIINPDNCVEAISLTTGHTLWTSSEKFKPLSSSNGKLICQALHPEMNNVLVIVELDLNRNGNIITRNTINLPENVRTGFTQTYNTSFNIQARVIDGQVYFSWEYHFIPPKGILEADSIFKISSEIFEQSGALMINRSSERLNSITREQLPRNFQSPAIFLDQRNRLTNLSTQQFLSKDEKFVLSSKKVADDIEFYNYNWDIYERASGMKVGQILDYRSFTPFYVTGTTIIYETGPYVRVHGDRIEEVPLKIVAVDLSTGNILWSIEILDTVYRGPVPA